MIIYILTFILGIFVGTLAGLAPGIHTNLVAVILLSSLAYFEAWPPLALVIFIVSMSITQSFVDFIPSVFLGAPDEDSFLSVLPGHQMLKAGKAHDAIVLTLYGSLAAIAVILILTPLFIYFLPFIYEVTRVIVPFALIFISIYLVLREKNPVLAIMTFSLAGFLGYASLNAAIKDPLFPLLTGLFGSSSIIISLKDKTTIPEQNIVKLKEIKLPKKEFFKAMIGSTLTSPLCSFLPGIGSGHAATISSEILDQSKEGFFVLVGAINTIGMGLSFVTVYAIERARTGSAVAIQSILQEMAFHDLLIILIAIVLSGIISFTLSIYLSKYFSKFISKINYKLLSIVILIVLTIMVIFFSNFLGIILYLTSTALGMFTILSGARRINLMSCLLIPTTLFYLFLQ